MKIREILSEQHGGTGSLQTGVAHALPDTRVYPELGNQDPYLQYRFGLAMAAAGAVTAGEIDYDPASAFGENLAIISRNEAEEEIVRIAQSLYPRAGSPKHISTRESEEASDVNKVSPLRPQGPIKRKA